MISFYHHPVFLISLTVSLKKFTPQPDLTSIIDLVLILSLLLTAFCHSVSNWLLTYIVACRNKIHNAQNLHGRVHKTVEKIATTIYQYVTNLLNLKFLEENRAVVLRMRLWAGWPQGSNSGKGECFLSSPKLPDWLWSPHSLVVSMYSPYSTGIKRPGSEPIKSRV